MNRALPIKIRLLAVCCHLSGLIWIAIFYSMAVSPILVVLAPLLTCLLTRKIHDFVDRSGKKVLNYHFSILLCYVCFLLLMLINLVVVMFYAAPGLSRIGSSLPVDTTGADDLKFFSSIFTGLWWVASNPQYLSLVHAMNISIAAFFTLRGKVFSYPLAIPFFRSPRT